MYVLHEPRNLVVGKVEEVVVSPEEQKKMDVELQIKLRLSTGMVIWSDLWVDLLC